jgi:glycosyltransferase involved in cell wall biosynthesis
VKTRVLHVIDSFDLGGGQTVVLNLAKYADRERFDVSVATMHGHGAFWEQFRALGIPVYSLSPRKWLPLYIPRLLQLIGREKFDVVHCHLFGANWIAKPLAAFAGVPVRIAHDHCNDALRYEQWTAFNLDRLTNRLSHHVCAVSESTRQFLIEKEGLPADRVSLIYNGVDVARFEQLPPRRDPARPMILGVGRLHRQKDFSLFLEVAHEVIAKHPTAKFVIAGVGPEEELLKQRAAELGLGERLRFAGPVSDLRELYSQASVLLLTSKYEGTPMVVLEAMAAGIPVVAPALDGICEILRDGEEAELVTGREQRSFADRILALLDDPSRAEAIATSARRKVRAEYSAEAMTRRVEAIYSRYLPAFEGDAIPLHGGKIA